MTTIPRARNFQNERETACHERLRRALDARENLIAVADETRRRVDAIDSDRYLTAEEKELRVKRARDEAGAELTARIAQARDALAEAVGYAREQVAVGKVDAEAQTRVRQLLERGLAPGQVLERAVQLGDERMVDAVRRELDYLSLDDRSFASSPELSQLVRDTELAVADQLPTTEGPVVRALLELGDNPGVEEAASFAVKAVKGDESAAHALLVYGYATSGDAGEAA